MKKLFLMAAVIVASYSALAGLTPCGSKLVDTTFELKPVGGTVPTAYSASLSIKGDICKHIPRVVEIKIIKDMLSHFSSKDLNVYLVSKDSSGAIRNIIKVQPNLIDAETLTIDTNQFSSLAFTRELVITSPGIPAAIDTVSVVYKL